MRRNFSALALFAFASLAASSAIADSVIRVVDVVFTPQGLPDQGSSGREERSPQIAVWVEKPDGTFVQDLYVTR